VVHRGLKEDADVVGRAWSARPSSSGHRGGRAPAILEAAPVQQRGFPVAEVLDVAGELIEQMRSEASPRQSDERVPPIYSALKNISVPAGY